VLGGSGLTDSARYALLNANYMMHRLKDHYHVRFTNEHGLCAHEFMVDLADFEKKAGIKVTDVAKRLQDYVRWPSSSLTCLTDSAVVPPADMLLANIDGDAGERLLPECACCAHVFRSSQPSARAWRSWTASATP
jgi:hypothetical protein